jgi:hypothetical protein
MLVGKGGLKGLGFRANTYWEGEGRLLFGTRWQVSLSRGGKGHDFFFSFYWPCLLTKARRIFIYLCLDSLYDGV